MRILMMLLALAAFAAAQMRMTLPDGSVVDAASVDGLTHFHYQGGQALQNTRAMRFDSVPGSPVFFGKLECKVGEIWVPMLDDTQPLRKCGWWPESLSHHMIVPGEILFHQTGPNGITPPNDGLRNAAWQLVSRRIDFGAFSYPRFDRLINLWGDEESGDMADVQRRYGAFFGGSDLEGWHDTWSLIGDGFNNEHYDSLSYIAIKYLRRGRVEDWNFGITLALAHACWGVVHSPTSRWHGMDRQEKSGWDRILLSRRVRGGERAPTWAKCWVRGLVTWELITGHPLLQRAVQARLEALKASNPATVWTGHGGARIGARYLDDLYIMFLRTGDQVLRQRAEAAIPAYLDLFDPQLGFWPNRLGRGLVDSPWMNAELAPAIGRWMRIGVARDRLEELLDKASDVWLNGTDDAYYPDSKTWGAQPTDVGLPPGVKTVRYRFRGDLGQAKMKSEDHTGHLSLLGYMVPMLRMIARYRPGWEERYLTHRDFLFRNAGGTWGRPAPSVEYRYGPGGSEHVKALLQIAGAVVR